MTALVCRLFGHRLMRVTVVDAHDGRRYYPHPNGSRLACRRCREVLPKKTG